MSGDQGFKNDGDLTGDAFAGDQGKEKKNARNSMEQVVRLLLRHG